MHCGQLAYLSGCIIHSSFEIKKHAKSGVKYGRGDVHKKFVNLGKFIVLAGIMIVVALVKTGLVVTTSQMVIHRHIIVPTFFFFIDKRTRRRHSSLTATLSISAAHAYAAKSTKTYLPLLLKSL